MRLGEAHLSPCLRTCVLVAGSQKITNLFFFSQNVREKEKKKKKVRNSALSFVLPLSTSCGSVKLAESLLWDKHLKKKV